MVDEIGGEDVLSCGATVINRKVTFLLCLSKKNMMFRRCLPYLTAAAGGSMLSHYLPIVEELLPSVDAASSSYGDKVGEFTSSGLIFKDTVEVIAIEDPKVKGVTIYVSNVKRPLTDRLMKSFFTDPSAMTVSVVKTADVLCVDEQILNSNDMSGEDVFSAQKSILFKSVHVKRIYDKKRKVLVYVAYNYSTATMNQDKLATGDGRYKTSISAIPVTTS